jgi:hypothetical protein
VLKFDYLFLRKRELYGELLKLLGVRSEGKKVKLPMCLIGRALCHEDEWRSEGVASLLLTSASDGGE